MNYTYAASICILLSVAFSPVSFSQFSLSTRLENYYDDNIYNNYEKIPDMVHSGSLDAVYDFESDDNNLQFYYMGNLTYFRDNNFKSSLSNKFGIVNTYFISEDGNPLNAGINFIKRDNRDVLSVYDLSQLSVYSNYRHFVNETDYFIAGYLFHYNNYTNFEDFTHFEHRGFIKYSSTFSSKTTLSLGAEIDLKLYQLKFNSPDIADGITQWKAYLQAAQNITSSTGISGYFMYRDNLSTGNRYINYSDYIFYEEEIFNDTYSNDGIETGASLIQLLTGDILLRGEFIYIQRNFNSLPVALKDGTETEILRKDHYYAIGAGMEFNLSGMIRGLGLTLSYNYLVNNSNDYFYNYDNNLTSIKLEWGF